MCQDPGGWDSEASLKIVKGIRTEWNIYGQTNI